MSSTPRTHSNALSLENQIKYQEAVDHKAQKLMSSTNGEIKQTSADIAKVLPHESKEVATQNPYVEFTEGFKSRFNKFIVAGSLREEEYRAVEEFVQNFDNYKTIDGLLLLRNKSNTKIIDWHILLFIIGGEKDFSENLHVVTVNLLFGLFFDKNHRSDNYSLACDVLKTFAQFTKSLKVAKEVASLATTYKQYCPSVIVSLCENKVLPVETLKEIINENDSEFGDDSIVREAITKCLNQQ